MKSNAEERDICLTLNSGAGTNLVLPLRGHDLGIGSRNVNVGIQTGLVVRFYYVSAKDLAGANTTVVGTLRSGETVARPAIGPAGEVEHGVFLLESEPELLLGVLLHYDCGVVTVVVGVGGAVGHPGLAHDEDVVAEAEGIRVEGDGAEVDIGVVTWSLRGRGTVKVPFGEIGDFGGLFWEGLIGVRLSDWSHSGSVFLEAHLALGAHAAGSVNPDILGNDLALLWQLEELFQRRRVADNGRFGLVEEEERLSVGHAHFTANSHSQSQSRAG